MNSERTGTVMATDGTTRSNDRRSPRRLHPRGLGRLAALAMLLALAPVGRWVPPAGALPASGSGAATYQAVRCLDGITGSLRATPTSIALWTSTTLSWNVTVPTGCSSIRLYLGSQVVARAGMLTVQPMASTVYRLRAVYSGSGEREVVTAPVTVVLPVDPASPGRRLVSIDASNWVPLLMQALRTENTTIVVANHVDMNLSNRESIRIASGVVLRGGRTSRDPGPRLYTTTRPKVLFDIDGDNVRISGVRIEGPDHFGVVPEDDEPDKGVGILVYSDINIEIDHNEIYGWSQAAVRVNDCDGKDWCPSLNGRMLPSENPNAVRIHDNYIHHNQHEGKNGYGVALHYGAYVLIERNVFDWNRHAIAGDGSSGTGYAAYRNLVLKNGGYHDTYCAPFVVCPIGVPVHHHYTHQFDMHGTDTCGIGHLNCGDAGYSMYIRHNTFLYTAGNAIKLRGIPEVGMFIGANVFAHDRFYDDAVVQTEQIGAYAEPGNVLGVDASTELGSCDFDGDGTDDSFMATGATWWYSSAGEMPWTYLNTSTVRLSEMSLGYFDGDNRCDVKVGDTIYPGGSTARSRFQATRLSGAGLASR